MCSACGPHPGRVPSQSARGWARAFTIVFAFIVHHSSFITPASAQPLGQAELGTPLSDRPLPIRVTNLGVEQGLSMSVGYTIFQDRYGFIWIGGQNGINRFDGYDVKVYKSEPFNPKSFTDGWIVDIDEDEEGNLWFATFVGVTRMDRVTETFTHYRHDPSDPESIASNTTFVVEPHADGRMWVSTIEGLDLLDPASGKAEHFQTDPSDSSSISHNIVSDILKDANGDFWFATVNGVNRLNRDRLGSFSSYLVSPEGRTPSSEFRAIFERSVEPGVLWLVARDGLVRFDPETSDTERYPYPFGLRPDGGDGDADLVQDPVNRNVLWMHTYGQGLLRFNIRSKRFVEYKVDRFNPTGLTSNSVESVYVDRSGTIWVGTEGNGVDRFNPSAAGVTHYRSAQGLNGALPGAGIWGIVMDSNGALWVATQDESSRHRVSQIDRDSGAFRHFEHSANDPGSLNMGGYFRFLKDHTGTLWIGAESGGGLSRFDPRTDRFIHYLHDDDDPKSLPHNDIGAMFEDRTGTLWVSTDAGLSQMDRETGQFKTYPVDADGTGIPPLIDWISEDQDATLWLGSRRSGLGRFDPVTGRTDRYRYDVNNPNSISSDGVNVAIERATEPGVVWIGTGAGLNRLDVASGRFGLLD